MSKELDLEKLKESWKEQSVSKNIYSKDQLVQMLNKKSSNNVKYVLVISIIEFIIIVLSLIYSLVNEDNSIIKNLPEEFRETYLRNYQIREILIYFNIVVFFGFILFFYKSYKEINIADSAKKLISSILKLRKGVNWFIIINIVLGFIILNLTAYYEFISGFLKGDIKPNKIEIADKLDLFFTSQYFILGEFLIILIIVLIFIGLYYYFVYGILMRKLKKNLKELQKHEENS